MQERRYTRRMRRRIRKRVLFSMAFLGFSILFYHSVQSFKQDRIASVTYAIPTVSPVARAAQDTVPHSTPDTPLQGPVAVGLAFRINGDPGLHAQLAQSRNRDTDPPIALPALVTRN